MLKRLMATVLLSHTEMLASPPALGWATILTVATLGSFIQGDTAAMVYVKVLVKAPAPGVNVPADALKTPPVPEVRVQVPPLCSPVIRVKRLMAAVLLSQTVTAPSMPASGCSLTLTVAMLASSMHGRAPVMV
jgi:hypothetical protein